MSKTHADTTLGDVAQTDRDNFSHVDGKENKTFKFSDVQAARIFMFKVYDMALKRLGIKVRPGMDANRIDRMLRSKGVFIEHREYPKDERVYKSGFFIYRIADHEETHRAEKELAYFISNPFTKDTGNIHLLRREFYIRTNVKIKSGDI